MMRKTSNWRRLGAAAVLLGVLAGARLEAKQPASKPAAKVPASRPAEKKALEPYQAAPQAARKEASPVPIAVTPLNPERTNPLEPEKQLVPVGTQVEPLWVYVPSEDESADEFGLLEKREKSAQEEVIAKDEFTKTAYLYPMMMGPAMTVWRPRAKPLPPANIGSRQFTSTIYANPIAPTVPIRWPRGAQVGTGAYPRQPLVYYDLGLTSAVFPTARWRIDLRPSIAPLQIHFFPGAAKGYSF